MRSKGPMAIAAFLLGLLAVKARCGTNVVPPNFAPSDRPASEPVVLELFTSEGCSSCPSADAFLKQLDDAGRADEVEIIAIEEHVDYWNRLGWTDPFSAHDWTVRQEQYARVFRRPGVYTPQLVVNGRSELVGSSRREAQKNIIEAAKIPGADLRLSTTKVSREFAEFSVAIENTPAEAGSAEIWLAVTERGLSSNVLRGENQGRNLVHAAILRSLTRVKLPRADFRAPEETKAKIRLDPAWKRENLRFVVFLQEAKTLHIVGAAAISLPR